MLLTFVRHAEAAASAGSDFQRELTERGQGQAAQVGAFLHSIKNPPQIILSSPLIRARQTAEAIKKKIESASLLEQPWLACGMKPEVCFQEMAAFTRFENVLLVGHEPDFSTSIATLLGNQHPGSIQVRKASICTLEIHSFSVGGGVLQYFLPSSLLPLS